MLWARGRGGWGKDGEEVGGEWAGGEDVEGREEGVDETDFFVGDEGEGEGDEEAGGCELAFYCCCEEGAG